MNKKIIALNYTERRSDETRTGSNLICWNFLKPIQQKLAYKILIIAKILIDLNELGTAESLTRLALNLFEKTNNLPRRITCHNNLAYILEKRGEYIKAEAENKKALDINLEDNPSKAISYEIKACIVFSKTRESEEAIEYQKKAIEIYKKQGGGEVLFSCYLKLSQFYRDVSKYEEAKAYLLNIENLFEKAPPQSRAYFYFKLGEINYYLEEWIESERYYLKVTKIEGAPRHLVASSYNNIGNALANRRRFDLFETAVENYEKALEIYKELNSSQEIALVEASISLVSF
ncbi:tetratricopeptide repeat protein [bacterium]|nr:tetratricopeptide repeat protein [bacterium]MBT4551475.1 tetratricopeptide repeat protein [bacterium]MBT7088397.1 tetratricopeptide repeat protein [bacterium]